MHSDGLYAETCVVGATEAVRGLGLSPWIYVHGGKRCARLHNTDTWRLIGWAAQRNPSPLDRPKNT